MFDEKFAQENIDKTAWLIRENWRLPTTIGKGSFSPKHSLEYIKQFKLSSKEVNTYFVSFTTHSSAIGDLYLFEGVSVIELFEYVKENQNSQLPEILEILSANINLQPEQLINSFQPKQLLEVYPIEAQVAFEQDSPLIHGSNHLLQICAHVDTWESHPTWELVNAKLYEHLIIFDDFWAAANPALANSILNCANQWEIFGSDLPKYERSF